MMVFSFLQRKKQAWEAGFARRCARLNNPLTYRLSMVLVPMFFGLLSLFLGQDENFDLRNYHLYNAYAILNGRVGVDMAPGQFQSYFNPALDVFYYLLVTNLPARVVGFIMGALHGLNFILLLAIGRQLLPSLAANDRYRLPLLLALVGCLGAGFLSELGNTMNDNMTALFILSAVWMVLKNWQNWSNWHVKHGIKLALAGAIMGLGVGLKLTNAVYAVGLCLAFVLVEVSLVQRLRLAFVFGIGVLLGLSISAGYWFWQMWEMFGNPLFPQFNSFFRSPLAKQVGIIDTTFMPKNMAERIFWPLLFTADYHRVSELPIRQLIWPLLYFALIVAAIKHAYLSICRRFRLHLPLSGAANGFANTGEKMPVELRFFLLFFIVSYIVWMLLFGIYRYLIVLELMAPLLLWLILPYIFKVERARKVGAYALLIALIAVFPFATWGHASWSEPGFRAQQPLVEQPAQSIVFTAHGDPPMSWLIPNLQKDLLFISVGSGFPESPAYLQRMNRVIASRQGQNYVMMFAHTNHDEIILAKAISFIDAIGVSSSEGGCGRLDRLLQRTRLHMRVKYGAPAGTDKSCTLELKPETIPNLPQKNRDTQEKVDRNLAHYDLKIVPGSCQIYAAYVGAEPFPYQFCRVTGHGR